MNNPIINLEGVDLYQMDQQVFNNITLKIDAGEFIYLIGETGSGKSSLLKAFYGELKVSAGNITLAGIDLNKIKTKEISNLRRKLGAISSGNTPFTSDLRRRLSTRKVTSSRVEKR